MTVVISRPCIFLTYISNFFLECGAGFTSKLEGMFRDIDLSRELVSCFKETKQAREEITGFELGVSVITASLWPTYTVSAVNIPQEVKK